MCHIQHADKSAVDIELQDVLIAIQTNLVSGISRFDSFGRVVEDRRVADNILS